MCCEDLVCASCAGVVADARCPVCRGARAELHGSTPLPAAALITAIVALLTLAAFLSPILTK
jgi:hypothetical protein